MDGLRPMACGQLDSTGGSFKHPRLGGRVTDDLDRVGKVVCVEKNMFFFGGVLKVDTRFLGKFGKNDGFLVLKQTCFFCFFPLLMHLIRNC